MSDEYVTCHTPLPDVVDVYTECESCADLRAQLDACRAELWAERKASAQAARAAADAEDYARGKAEAHGEQYWKARAAEIERDELKAELSGKAGELAVAKEQVEALEADRDGYRAEVAKLLPMLDAQSMQISNLARELDESRAREAATRKVLEWYANLEHYPHFAAKERCRVTEDMGSRARTVLAWSSPAVEWWKAMQVQNKQLREQLRTALETIIENRVDDTCGPCDEGPGCDCSECIARAALAAIDKEG